MSQRPPPLCAVCLKPARMEPARMEAWGHILCGPCFGAWSAESPRLSAIAAMVPPEDVELRQPSKFGGEDFLLLREGAARVLTDWTSVWVTDTRREFAREAARKKAEEG